MPRKPSKPVKASKPSKPSTRVEPYEHSTPKAPLRPDVGTQAQFKKKLPPKTYRYDSSLSPAMDWDVNPVRELGDSLIKRVQEATTLDEAKAAIEELRRISKSFLNWTGKAEHLSVVVPTLPLFVHERLSTQAILATLQGHKKDHQVSFMDELFKDPRHSVTDQVLKAYEFQDDWVNRLVLGDSLMVMNSLLHYENMGGKIQTIFMDPPYGVKFGSNFQPFVRANAVKHGDDDDMTREPEMVQAYRDTWELGVHSYLSYLRDRLTLSRELLTQSGSIFVQISDENQHLVRQLLDEVFGSENFVAQISFKKRTSATADYLGEVSDYLLFYAKSYKDLKYRQLFDAKLSGGDSVEHYNLLENPKNGRLERLDLESRTNLDQLLADGWKLVAFDSLMTAERGGNIQPFEFEGKTYDPGKKNNWKTSPDGMEQLKKEKRIVVSGNTLRYKRYLNDFSAVPLTSLWADTTTFNQRSYVVQTIPKVVERCILMSTDPGDLVFDPTCGSGTTAFVAEQWGRRWITCDVSRVPLALTRQRLLTATYPYYDLKSPGSGPVGGFIYKRKMNAKGEEVGGIVPHITLKAVANNEPATEEILVDRPEVLGGVTRVSGPFTFEATIPAAQDFADTPSGVSATDSAVQSENYVDRMIEILRQSPKLQLPGNKTATFTNIRTPAKTLSLSAEAVVPNGKDKVVALIFGPENGAVSERLVHESAKEAAAKKFEHLYVVGFAIQANARELIENCEEVMGVAATYVQATPDLLMGDLLKNLRSSQIFSVCGLPEISLKKLKGGSLAIELLGLDVFDPISVETHHQSGGDVPAWFLDTDYNGLSFHVTQAFFPRTQAWDNLKKALKADFEESAWSHLAGSESAPFEAGENKRIAVKVIDDRGNELMVVQDLK